MTYDDFLKDKQKGVRKQRWKKGVVVVVVLIMLELITLILILTERKKYNLVVLVTEVSA